MKTFAIGALALAAIAGSASAATRTINFDQDALGNSISDLTAVSNQYAAWGVTFTPNAFTGGSWATNTGMTATSTDVGGGYNPSLNNVLHAFNADWLAEDGDPSFLISFSTGITSISLDVIGDTGGRDGLQTFVALYDASLTQIGFFDASGIGGVENISLSGFGTAFFAAIAHGDFGDWVGIDNITYTEVPAPGALALVGLAGVFAGRRRR
jgi:MYXO-CTERM domain-containing protein